jgi:hypothetical protein
VAAFSWRLSSPSNNLIKLEQAIPVFHILKYNQTVDKQKNTILSTYLSTKRNGGGFMTKMLSLISFMIVFLGSAGISADRGSSVFQSNKCGMCHKPDTSEAARPSLKDTSQAYQAKASSLIPIL